VSPQKCWRLSVWASISSYLCADRHHMHVYTSRNLGRSAANPKLMVDKCFLVIIPCLNINHNFGIWTINHSSSLCSAYQTGQSSVLQQLGWAARMIIRVVLFFLCATNQGTFLHLLLYLFSLGRWMWKSPWFTGSMWHRRWLTSQSLCHRTEGKINAFIMLELTIFSY